MNHRSHPNAIASCLLLCATLVAPAARAQSAADKAAAEALFDDAKRLVAAGKYADACPKFVESQKLDPGIGTLLYLGDCYEKNGQLASAWAAFREAASTAKAAGQAAREKTANTRADALDARLPRLSVQVPPAAAIEGLAVERDGAPVAKPLWGTAFPVDPGEHVVRASAPGKAPWSVKVNATPGVPITVTIPALAAAAPAGPATAPVAPPPSGSSWSGQKTFALVSAGVGVAGLVVGGVFGAQTMSKWSDAKSNHCTGPSGSRVCDDTGVTEASDARTAGTISTIGFVVGGVGIAGAAILWATAPSHGASVAIRPAVGPGVAALSAAGTF